MRSSCYKDALFGDQLFDRKTNKQMEAYDMAEQRRKHSIVGKTLAHDKTVPMHIMFFKTKEKERKSEAEATKPLIQPYLGWN